MWLKRVATWLRKSGSGAARGGADFVENLLRRNALALLSGPEIKKVLQPSDSEFSLDSIDFLTVDKAHLNEMCVQESMKWTRERARVLLEDSLPNKNPSVLNWLRFLESWKPQEDYSELYLQTKNHLYMITVDGEWRIVCTRFCDPLYKPMTKDSRWWLS